jgi:hypothetical protein
VNDKESEDPRGRKRQVWQISEWVEPALTFYSSHNNRDLCSVSVSSWLLPLNSSTPYQLDQANLSPSAYDGKLSTTNEMVRPRSSPISSSCRGLSSPPHGKFRRLLQLSPPKFTCSSRCSYRADDLDGDARCLTVLEGFKSGFCPFPGFCLRRRGLTR